MAEREPVLYYRPLCPYCRRVLAFMDANGITLPLRDITADRDAYRTLVEVGGMDQVPCLFIDGRPLYESADIIDYLREHVMK